MYKYGTIAIWFFINKNHVDIKVVSELLGHTDVQFTYNRYIHIIQKQKAEAINLINITPRLDS